MLEQQNLIGKEKFWILGYEEFCRDPVSIVKRVAHDILDIRVDESKLNDKLKPFNISNKVKVAPDIFERIKRYPNQNSL